jgi:glycosidase
MRNRLACLVLAAGCLAFAPLQGQAPPSADAPDTSWVASSALYEVFVQDFSPQGTFLGVIDGLDRIHATGTNVVWLMPIHPIGVKERKGTLGSPYAARDYRAVNPAYGTPDDFRALVRAVHDRGMKLILDWVPDHTSMDHAWIEEHPDWYFRNEQGGPSVPRGPDGVLTDWTDVAQLDYGNPEVRREMIAIMRWWLTEYGIDGYRVDVAGYIPSDFWREAVPAMRAAVPRTILLLAEWDDPELHRIGYDLTYAWDSIDTLTSVWKGQPASGFVRQAIEDMKSMPPVGGRMRFTTNHDKTAWEDPPLKIFGGSAGARAAYVAVALLPGRPLLYNGQEVESPQKLALFERGAIEWNQPRAKEARAFYRRIVELTRRDSSFLSAGLEAVETSAPRDVIAYRRGEAVVLVNARRRPVRFTVRGGGVAGAEDLLSDRTQRGDTIELPAYGTMVLKPPGRRGR